MAIFEWDRNLSPEIEKKEWYKYESAAGMAGKKAGIRQGKKSRGTEVVSVLMAGGKVLG